MKTTRWKSTGIIAGIGLALSASGLALAQTELTVENDGMSLTAGAVSSNDVLSMKLRIVGPNGFAVEQRVEDSLIQWAPQTVLADGTYRWEAIAVTVESGAPFDQKALASVQAADSDGGPGMEAAVGNVNPHTTTIASPEINGPGIQLPVERLYSDDYKNVDRQSGSFTVKDGWIIPNPADRDGVTANDEPGLVGSIAGAISEFLFPSAHAQQIFTQDVEIEKLVPSLYLNNQDGSAGNEWRFWVGNSSGDLYFQDNTTLGTPYPLRIEFDGIDDTVRINEFGDVGFGTGAPTQQLHMSSNFPQIRIEDVDGAQSWYVKNSNAGRFEIGETSALSGAFVIQPGAPGSSLAISPTGNVGIGTDSPNRSLTIVGPSGFPGINITNESAPNGTEIVADSSGKMRFGPQGQTKMTFDTANGNLGINELSPDVKLHVRGTDGTGKIILEETQSIATNSMFTMTNNGNPGFQLENSNSGVAWQFRLGGSGPTEQFTINKTSISGPELSVLASGDIRIKGAYISSSSRTTKQEIVRADERDILEQVTRMPIYEWSYKNSPDSRHVGPMAEEYHEIFALAGGGTGLAGTDMAGLSLASVKALHAELLTLKKRIKMLENNQVR